MFFFVCLPKNYPTSTTQESYEERQVLYSFRDEKIEAQRDGGTCSRLGGLLISEHVIAFKEFLSLTMIEIFI